MENKERVAFKSKHFIKLKYIIPLKNRHAPKNTSDLIRRT